eukprot:CCRYP_004727-RA/>CCRYP_004727-RA protein AED:0.36 eAED:0.36 QI:0/0/0/1/0/0/4/0/312
MPPASPSSGQLQANHCTLQAQQPSTCLPYRQSPSTGTLSQASLTTSLALAHCAMQVAQPFHGKRTHAVADAAAGLATLNAPRLWKLNLTPPQDAIALHVARHRATLAPTHHKDTHVDKLAPTHTVKPPTCPRVHTHLRTHDLPTTRALVASLHATAGYPVKSTWLQAIKCASTTPGLDSPTRWPHGPTTATHQIYQASNVPSADFPASPQHDIDIFTVPLNKIFTDDGSLPPTSAQWKPSVPYPTSMMSTVRRVPRHPCAACNANRKPMVHIMDNEASLAFRQAITSNSCTFQLVPPRGPSSQCCRTSYTHI